MLSGSQEGSSVNWLEERQNVRVGTVMNLDSDSPVTVLRDWDTLVIPSMRIDAGGLAVLRQILNNEGPALAEARAEMEADEAERLAHAEWQEG
jgi:hypothetical protein